MESLSFEVICKAVEHTKAIQLHKIDLQRFLSQTPKADPLYDDINKLLKLCNQIDRIRIDVNTETAKFIHEINALDAQVGEKLNYLNRMAR